MGNWGRLAEDAKALSEQTPSAGHDVEEFTRWSKGLNGLLAVLFSGEEPSTELREAGTSAQAVGELLTQRRTLKEKALNYSAANRETVAASLQTLSDVLSKLDARRPYVFISFSQKDRALAESIAGVIKQIGLDFFFSPDPSGGIRGGEPWFPQIVEAVRASTHLLLVATPNSAPEHWTTFESGAVLGSGGRVLPLFVGLDPEQLPGPFRSIQGLHLDRPRADYRPRLEKEFGRTIVDGPALEALEDTVAASVVRFRAGVGGADSVIAKVRSGTPDASLSVRDFFSRFVERLRYLQPASPDAASIVTAYLSTGDLIAEYVRVLDVVEILPVGGTVDRIVGFFEEAGRLVAPSQEQAERGLRRGQFDFGRLIVRELVVLWLANALSKRRYEEAESVLSRGFNFTNGFKQPESGIEFLGQPPDLLGEMSQLRQKHGWWVHWLLFEERSGRTPIDRLTPAQLGEADLLLSLRRVGGPFSSGWPAMFGMPAFDKFLPMPLLSSVSTVPGVRTVASLLSTNPKELKESWRSRWSAASERYFASHPFHRRDSSEWIAPSALSD